MLVKNLFFKHADNIRTFGITRLASDEIEEKVWLQKDDHTLDVTRHHAMICLDPFCMAVWLPEKDAGLFDLSSIKLNFQKGRQLNACIYLSLIEKMSTPLGMLFLYKISKVKNYQLSVIHRLVFFGYLTRSKKNTWHSREVISALYSYPRSIIIVSYQDDGYYNIFPMDIHGYIEEEKMYLLGLRTTNTTLNKILDAKKVVICDTSNVDIDTVYNLGKHSSSAPTPKNELKFSTGDSELFGFPVPDFSSAYKEVAITDHKKMGYHMLMLGTVVNEKKLRPDAESLYHVGFLQFQHGSYKPINGLF